MNIKLHALAAICVASLASPFAASAVELNQASRAQLESLRGLGVEGTERILQERSKGDFKSWLDFMARNKGVKQAMATRFSRAGLTVNGAAFEGPSTLDGTRPSSPALADREQGH